MSKAYFIPVTMPMIVGELLSALSAVCLYVSGRYLVVGYNCNRVGQGRATPLWTAPHEGFIPHPKEQPANSGGKLQQTA